jgi:hypothetical protein
MEKPSKPRRSVMFAVSSTPSAWRSIFGGEVPMVTQAVLELLREQRHLLESAHALSGADLEICEIRSDGIRGMIRKLAEEQEAKPNRQT